MKKNFQNDLNQIALEIKARIQAYADRHNISFEEAQKRARITINGKSFKVSEEQSDGQEE